MAMHQYFMGMSQLELINRAPGFFKYQPHNVAAHSWKVTQIAQFLADVKNKMVLKLIGNQFMKKL